jgi:hypothetical protein
MKKGKRGGKREEQSSSLLSGILLIEVKIKGRKWRNSQRSRERRDVLSRRALQKRRALFAQTNFFSAF